MSEAPTLSQALIYDLAGRVQQRFTKAQQQDSLTLPLPSAAPGLYLLRIEEATGQTSTRRFVRQ
ncbi:MAG: T9SS type A sorting domain-containing protein [Janthinobacterium lividum]